MLYLFLFTLSHITCGNDNRMTITFTNNKPCRVLKNYVEALEDDNTKDLMVYSRKLKKEFPSANELVLNVYQRLKNAPNAEVYNRITQHPDRKIELKRAVGNSDPLVLKVRIENTYYRKFFYHVNNSNEYTKEKEWSGNFVDVTKICIFDINYHKYKR